MTFSLGTDYSLDVDDEIAISIKDLQFKLYCRVVRLDANVARCFVVNGAWHLDVDMDTGMTRVPYEGQGKICWIGKVPAPHSNTYNDALDWIDNFLTANAP